VGGAALKVEGLSVSYGNVAAVREVSFHAEPGELIAFVGANGAGKTSTLGAIVGLVPAAAGEVWVDDVRLSGMRPERVVRSGVALSPEGRRVFARLTVEENLRLGGMPLADRGAVSAKIAEVLELFPRLRERIHVSAGDLSGGEQQMLAIGRALMADPQVLLLDEPSLGLAPRIVEQIFELLRRLNQEGMTMLLVEQNVAAALEIASRAYVLVQGRIAAAGSAAEVMEKTDLAALYLGSEADR